MNEHIFYKNLNILENLKDFSNLYFNKFELYNNDKYKLNSCNDDDLNKIIYYTFNESMIYLNNMSIYDNKLKRKLEFKINSSIDNIYNVYVNNSLYENDDLLNILNNMEELIDIYKSSYSCFNKAFSIITYPIYSFINEYNYLVNPLKLYNTSFIYAKCENLNIDIDCDCDPEPEVEPEVEPAVEPEPEPVVEPEPEPAVEPEPEPVVEPEIEPEPEPEPVVEPEAEPLSNMLSASYWGAKYLDEDIVHVKKE